MLIRKPLLTGVRTIALGKSVGKGPPPILLNGRLLGVRAIAEVTDLESWFLSVT